MGEKRGERGKKFGGKDGVEASEGTVMRESEKKHRSEGQERRQGEAADKEDKIGKRG